MRRAAIVVLCAAARVAWGGGACEEGRAQTGLVVADGPRLAVVAVDDGSPAAAAGVRAGDEILQVNGAVPARCADWSQALRAARRARLALLLLVRRGEGETPLVLAATAWERGATAAPSTAPAAPSARPPAAAAPPPAPLPAETAVSLEAVLRALAALAPAERPPARLAAYRRDLDRLRRETETLAVRRASPPPVVERLRAVLRYYEAAALAWDAEEQLRERERRPRRLPLSDAAVAPYFSDSEIAATVEEFPFLRAVVVREPGPGLVPGESAGLWRPLQARAALWERGREELERLAARIAAGG